MRLHRCSLEHGVDALNCMYDSIEIIPNGLMLKATCGGQGSIEMAMAAIVVSVGGRCFEGSEVAVEDADSVVIFIAGETSSRNPDAGSAALATLAKATDIDWSDLVARHLEVYTPIISRVNFSL